ncbi:LysR family transcriptional regulator [Bacillus sp. AFS088145]|uniref:LysR family transcriptional regulator n=1 Tax=Bacillus sp. AFS088145 TaxID=2033514 RepID=UPI000BF997AB|nr:LysR family transcriptional regulator [Bacillus sp. AFS088145]PFH87759.1 hypothetical protein COI44_09120 [Bacillus sp. AFS088145]
MRIEQLLYITEIAKTGSIANTAERLFVSSPGISLAISNLEEELGVKIFERSRTGLEPTETGKNLITRAQDILNRIEEFKHEAKSNYMEIEGHLTISAVSNLCRSIIPKTSAELKAKFPKVTLHIKESLPSQVRKDVLNGDADIGLFATPSSLLEENQLLTTTHILDSSVMICFKKDSELASKNFLTMEDLHEHPVAIAFNKHDKKTFYSIFGKFNKLNILVQSQNSETRKYFISQGLALGFEPNLIIQSDSFYQNEDIIVKPVVGLESKLSYFAIRLKKQYFSAAGKEFMKELHNQANHFKE